VLARPGAITLAFAVDVRLAATAILTHPLEHDAGVTFLSATSESEAKLRLLDRDELLPGDSAWAQVVLASPVAVVRGDHCIIRTPNETAAGGIVVAVNPRRHRRHHAETLAALERQLAGSPADQLVDLLLGGPSAPEDARRRLNLEPAPFAAALAETTGAATVVERAGRLVAVAWLDSAVGRVSAAADEFLAANRLRIAAPREHLRSAVRLDQPVFEIVAAEAVARGVLEERSGAALARPGYEPQLTARQQDEAARVLAALRTGGFSPPTDALPDPSLLAYLAERRLVVDTGAGVVYEAAVFEAMTAMVRSHIERTGSISLAAARDLFSTSRKYAQAFLEHLDALRVTRRSGDTRTLR
jgi:selenocysteine-specific elongation factor